MVCGELGEHQDEWGVLADNAYLGVSMRILLVVAYFVPEIGSAAHIYFDLAKAFLQRGHEVHVITSYPRRFNLSSGDANNTFPLDESIDGIYVHRCKHNAIRDNMVMRGIEHFLLPYYYFRSYRRLNQKFDACLIYIPPLPLYYFARAVKIFDGTSSVLNYQDFHPQELTDVGILKNGLLIKIMEYIEHQSYKNADFITVLSEGGIDYVARRGADPSKIEHIYNGCMISNSNEPPIRRDFKKKQGIEDKILITYAGILSPFQGLDQILNAAKELTEHRNLIFYLVGDGLTKNHLAQRIEKENILNVRMLPFQQRDEYLNIISSSDISIVPLDRRMNAPCIPGKLINLMSRKQPIVAIVSHDCETKKIIEKASCGIVVEPNDTEGFKKAIVQLSEDSLNRIKLGKSGRLFLERNMSLDRIEKTYESIFEKIKK